MSEALTSQTSTRYPLRKLLLHKLAWALAGGLVGVVVDSTLRPDLVPEGIWPFAGTLIGGALGGGRISRIGWFLVCGAFMGVVFGLDYQPLKGWSEMQLFCAWIGTGLGLVCGLVLELIPQPTASGVHVGGPAAGSQDGVPPKGQRGRKG